MGSQYINQFIGFKQPAKYYYKENEQQINVTVELHFDAKDEDYKFGVRTTQNTAKSPEDFDAIDEVLTFEKGSAKNATKTIAIKINFKPASEDEEKETPKTRIKDKHFHIEIYDPNDEEKPKLFGDDTDAKIVLIDGSASKMFEELKIEATLKCEQMKKDAALGSEKMKADMDKMKEEMEKQGVALKEAASPDAIFAAAEEAAKNILTKEQKEQIERVEAFVHDPEKALYSEVEKLFDDDE